MRTMNQDHNWKEEEFSETDLDLTPQLNLTHAQGVAQVE